MAAVTAALSGLVLAAPRVLLADLTAG
jgi:hypothetical protein